MKVAFETTDDVLRVRVEDPRLDAHTAPELRAQAAQHIGAATTRVLLDISALEFVDSTGLGALLAIRKGLPPGARMVLNGCRPEISQLLRLTRLDKVFPTSATEDEGLEWLQATAAVPPMTANHACLAPSGFTLIELLVVVAMVGVLAAISIPGLQAALTTSRVQASIGDLRVHQQAIQLFATDCSRLPRSTRAGDPGFSVTPRWRWARSCWRGPYLNYWGSPTKLGGELRYRGRRNQKPVLRTMGLGQAPARLLARAISQQYGEESLGRVGRSGGRWFVDLVVDDAPIVQ
jgi:anti-sigma B factor antagonist